MQRSLDEWRTVFWLAFGIFHVTNLVYVVYASGDIQPWNTPHLMNKQSDDPIVLDPKDDTNSAVQNNERFSNKVY